MAVLPDWTIERDVTIEPFSPMQRRPGVISYGVTSYGYDVRAGYRWKVFDDAHGGMIDPKAFDPKLLRDVDLTPTHHVLSPYSERGAGATVCARCNRVGSGPGWEQGQCGEQKPNFVIVPPNSYVLGESVERFRVPRDILVVCMGKSTYARCGIIVNVTPGEPEWLGHWTIEISNSSRLPAKVYCNEGVMQCIFLRAESPCKTSYADKNGKYQDQKGLTLPSV